ncbi:transcriptional regulator [Afipia sp. P52-10]|jgi:tRNA-Thr(GGU) m(6)t(6)A37 methyltransferase TsaA|uniref:SAM-dependent methyltransferase n=1 Tax=Afipia sp. P52-10 TaxID=1429916 RepID=UPI0003DF40E1|nr:SAM-dependent methyltransferase [Afipia sp. P52-10]ETR76839.1 transcriptional regulator [Afipia sp. P52-10]
MSEILPIGVVRGGRTEPVDDDWGRVEAEIVLDAGQFSPEATAGLDDFSHITVIYQFHRVSAEEITSGARHPRGRTDWPKVGIFAQRGKGRPNRIGVTTCELVAVDGLTLRVRGLDAIDGTPVLDVKPHMTGFAPRGAVREPAWVKEIMKDYW